MITVMNLSDVKAHCYQATSLSVGLFEDTADKILLSVFNVLMG